MSISLSLVKHLPVTSRFQRLARSNPCRVQDRRYLRTSAYSNQNLWFWFLHCWYSCPAGCSLVSNRSESRAAWYRCLSISEHWRFASPPNVRLSRESICAAWERNRYRFLRCIRVLCRIYRAKEERGRRVMCRPSYESVSISNTSNRRTIRGWSNVLRISHSRRACLRTEDPSNEQRSIAMDSLDIVGFLLLFPFLVQLVNLHGHVALFFQTECLKDEDALRARTVPPRRTLCTSLKPPLPMRLSNR